MEGALVVMFVFGFLTRALRNGYTLFRRLSDLNDSGIVVFVFFVFWGEKEKRGSL